MVAIQMDIHPSKALAKSDKVKGGTFQTIIHVRQGFFFQVSQNIFVHVLKDLADSFTVPVLVLFRMISANLRLRNEKIIGWK